MEVVSQGLSVFSGQLFTTRYDLIVAAAMIVIVPVLAVAIAIAPQRHIVEGIALGWP